MRRFESFHPSHLSNMELHSIHSLPKGILVSKLMVFTGNANPDLTVSAVVSGAGLGITKAGAGALVLGGIVATTSGTVTVRATDSDRSQGARSLETLHVDQLMIRTESDPNASPPAAPGP